MSLIRTEIRLIPYIQRLQSINIKEVTKMKKNYEEPEMEELLLEFADVICISEQGETGDDFGPDWN